MSSGQRSTPAAATTETNPQVNNKLFVPHRATRHEPQPAPRLERLGPWQRLGPRRARQVAHHSVALLPKQSPHCRHPWPPKARIGPPQRQGQRPLLARSAFRCRLPTPSPSPPPAHSSWQPPARRSAQHTDRHESATSPNSSRSVCAGEAALCAIRVECGPRSACPQVGLGQLVHRTEVSEGRQDWGGPAAPVRPAAEAELAAGALECGCRDSYGGGGLLKGGIGEGGDELPRHDHRRAQRAVRAHPRTVGAGLATREDGRP